MDGCVKQRYIWYSTGSVLWQGIIFLDIRDFPQQRRQDLTFVSNVWDCCLDRGRWEEQCRCLTQVDRLFQSLRGNFGAINEAGGVTDVTNWSVLMMFEGLPADAASLSM